MASFLRKIFKKPEIQREEITLEQLKQQPLPRHVAIIMDGNGRWARARALPRAAGHRAGMETLKTIVDTSIEIGIEYLSVYAFSTENWRRPREEVDALMGLLVEYVEKELNMLNNNGVRVRAIGKIEQLPVTPRLQIMKAAERTSQNSRLNLQIALNYGGRLEIVDAIHQIVKDIKNSTIADNEIDEALVSSYLYTKGIPDPDLMIRPSGEMRVSNFLLWQLAYTEFWVTNTLWPDFQARDYISAIYDYQQRERRYGGLLNNR